MCATYFLAWLSRYEGDETEETRDDSPPGTPLLDRLSRLYARWNRHMALERRKWLRASVVALGASIVLLPAAFVPLGKRPAAPSIQWPVPARAAPASDIELRKILYQAQVSEATKITKAPVTGRFDWAWWLLAAGLGVLVVVLAQFPLERPPDADGEAG